MKLRKLASIPMTKSSFKKMAMFSIKNQILLLSNYSSITSKVCELSNLINDNKILFSK